MKIVHVIGAFLAGGAEVFISDLAVAQKKTGRQVYVYALSSRTDKVGESLKEKLERNNISYGFGSTSKVGARSVIQYAKYIQQISPDIVHLHTRNTERAEFLKNMLKRRKYKLARTVHSVKHGLSKINRLVYAINNIRLSVACSQAASNNAYLKSKKTIVINNGIDFDWPGQAPGVQQLLKQKLSLSAEKKHYLVVGGMYGESPSLAPKAHDIIIRAWKRSDKVKHSSVLHIIGDGPLREKLEVMAIGCDSIVFHGIKNNVKEWLQAVDIFLMPSRFEGLPIAGIEAVGTGLPCIFSSIEPFQPLAQPNVYWVPADSEDDLKSALEKVGEKANSLSEVEVTDFRSTFCIEIAEKKYAEYYSKLCESRI